MNYLYDKFNIKDNYIVSGDLYRKQGAGYPVRIITLDGRRTTGVKAEHPTDIEIVKDWDTLYNKLKGEIENGNLLETKPSDSVDGDGIRPNTQGSTAENSGRGSGRHGGSLGSHSGTSGGNSGRAGVLGENNESETGSRTSGSQNQSQESDVSGTSRSEHSDGVGVGSSTGRFPSSTENAENTTDNQTDTGIPGTEGSGVSVRHGEQSTRSSSHPTRGLVGEERGALNNNYIAGSQNPTDKMDVVIPRYMASGLAQSLERLKDSVGDIDAFVQKELGYDTPEELFNSLADAQIDGVALAIQAIKNHNGFVLGDQTGIGKGRQCASMIRWAQNHDIFPVFITADQKLFTDMYRDGKDIGNVFKPLLMASAKDKAEIANENGKIIVPLPRSQQAAFQNVLNGQSEYDVVFTSYSQLPKSTGRQQQFFA